MKLSRLIKLMQDVVDSTGDIPVTIETFDAHGNQVYEEIDERSININGVYELRKGLWLKDIAGWSDDSIVSLNKMF